MLATFIYTKKKSLKLFKIKVFIFYNNFNKNIIIFKA
jgi:hypothetical protein